MKIIKKRICLLLSFAVVASCLLTACGSTTSESMESVMEPAVEAKDIVIEKEFERALSYGLVPEGW